MTTQKAAARAGPNGSGLVERFVSGQLAGNGAIDVGSNHFADWSVEGEGRRTGKEWAFFFE